MTLAVENENRPTKRLIFNRPPSLDRVLSALNAWHRRDMDGLTPDTAHEIAAVFYAAEIAQRGDLLRAKGWHRQKHHAAACIGLHDKVAQHSAYRGHNCPPMVDINFRRGK